MNYLFYLGHPAHYLNVSVVAGELARRGHGILFVARDKDVLFDLLEDTPYRTWYLKKRTGRGRPALVATVLRRALLLSRIALQWRPDLLIGTDVAITHVGRLLRIPSVVVNEDDAAAVPLFARYGLRYATRILAPRCCDSGPYAHKQVGYDGYQELAYLHPRYFTPDPAKAAPLFDGRDRYFILRLSALSAHHDGGKTGLTDALARALVARLEPHGRVYITSERPLDPAFEPYRLRIHPRDVHHVLYYASLYVGDSQTMTAEAAVLGTPALRFNDFVGRLGYLEELEHVYGLTYGIRTHEPEKLFERIDALLAMPDLKRVWQGRRDDMLSQTVDVAAFFCAFFESFPRVPAAGVPARGPVPSETTGTR